MTKQDRIIDLESQLMSADASLLLLRNGIECLEHEREAFRELHRQAIEDRRLLRGMLRDLLKVFDFPDDRDMMPSGARIIAIRDEARRA